MKESRYTPNCNRFPHSVDWLKEIRDRQDFGGNMVTNYLGPCNHARFVCVRRIVTEDLTHR